MSEALLRAIKIMGSAKNLADAISVRAATLDNWLNKNVNVPLQHAIEIERATAVRWPETAPYLAHFELIWKASKIDCWFLGNQQSPSIEHLRISLAEIKRDENMQRACNSSEEDLMIKIIKVGSSPRLICIDTQHRLIYGHAVVKAHDVLNKKHILSWKLSLEYVLQGCYPKELIRQYFTLSERIAIGIAVEKEYGDAHRRNKKVIVPLKNNKETLFFVGRMIERLSLHLELGSRDSYYGLKKIYLKGSLELIAAVDNQAISIAAAVVLADLPQEEQDRILALPKLARCEQIKKLRITRQTAEKV